MKKLMSLLVVASAFLSCTDDDIRTEQDFSNGPKVVGFISPLATVEYFSDEGVVMREFPMSLIGNGNGQPSSTPIEVMYEVDEASTATEGVEFDFVDASGKIVIPAGGTFGNFPINVNTGSLNPTEKTQLILNLTSSSAGSVVGQQYSQLRITFVGCQSQLQGGYNVVISTVAGTSTRTNEIVSVVGVNSFQTRYVGRWALGTFTPAGYNFIDICGEISVPDQNLGQYSNQVYGIDAYGVGVDGIVTSPTRFEVKHNISFAAGDQTQNYVYTRNN